MSLEDVPHSNKMNNKNSFDIAFMPVLLPWVYNK